MLNILAAVALVAVLIIIHEAGHFVAAKLCGVDVPIFSVGIGRRLLGFRYKETDYRLSLLPFGGYVMMAGADPFGTTPVGDAGERSFLRKPVGQRIFVIAAGPLANLVLPVVVFSVLLMIGEPRVDASLGNAAPALALEPGDRIVAIDDEPIAIWREVMTTVEHLSPGDHTLTVARGDQQFVRPFSLDAPATVSTLGLTHRRPAPTVGVDDPGSPAGRAGLRTGDTLSSVGGVAVADWWAVEDALSGAGQELVVQTSDGASWTLTRAGDEPWGLASAVMFVGEVAETLPSTGWGPDQPSPAAQAGIQPGDHLVTIDGAPLQTWHDIQRASAAEAPVTLGIVRDGVSMSVSMTPMLIADQNERGLNQTRPVLGLSAAGGTLRGPLVTVQHGPLGALRGGVSETVALGTFMLEQLGYLVTGEAALSKSVGGPVEMVRQASAAAQAGAMHYARLMGILSLSVGIVNLLPVPVLDGGQLFFFLAEALRGRPLSLHIRERAQQVGVLALTMLTLVVLVMDIHRLLVG